jgi:hypothetical protein
MACPIATARRNNSFFTCLITIFITCCVPSYSTFADKFCVAICNFDRDVDNFDKAVLLATRLMTLCVPAPMHSGTLLRNSGDVLRRYLPYHADHLAVPLISWLAPSRRRGDTTPSHAWLQYLIICCLPSYSTSTDR